MDEALLICRLVLAGVFLVAAVAKVLDLPRTREGFESLGVPGAVVPAASILVPLAELAVAITLVPSATATAAAIAALVLLAAFTAFVAVAVARGTEAECNCFGNVSSRPVGAGTLVRNTGLLVLAGFVAAGGAGTSATGWVADLSTAEAVLASISVVLGLGVAFNLAFLFQLFRQNGRLVAEIADLREKSGLQPDPPAIGEPVPSFALTDLSGRTVTLENLLADGRGLLLLVTSPDCGACEPLLPRMGSLVEEQGDLRPVMLSLGSLDDVRSKAFEHGIDPVLVMPDFELPRSLGITGSPGALVVDAGGRVASAPALGTAKVDELLSAWTGPLELVTVEGGG
jgi:uncharacterized membrane protein YphA (DoxX/SURF4 family)